MSKCPNGCKDTKYNLLLKFESWQKEDVNFQANVVLNLKEAMNWSEQKSKTTVEFATMQGYCLLDSGISDDMTKLSLKLAQKSIPHELKISKK